MVTRRRLGEVELAECGAERYAALLSEGVDPVEAHRIAFSADEVSEADPAERYAALLGSGLAPHLAWESAYVPDTGAGLSGTLGPPPPPGPPVHPGPGAVGSFRPPETIDLGGGYLAVRNDNFFVEADAYHSYVYKVNYRRTSVGLEEDAFTFMRIQIPNFNPLLWKDFIPMVLALPGGNDILAAVEDDEDGETLYEQRYLLASGGDFPTSPMSGVDALYRYRSGPPMITILATYPGRGVYSPVDERNLQASPASEHLAKPTPENQAGMDYTGQMTSDAVEAIVQAALSIVTHLQDGIGPWVDGTRAVVGLGPFHALAPRLVVMSYSDGLNAAALWIRRTDVTVHALVDYEGPADAIDRAMIANAYDPYAETLTYEAWSTWAQTPPSEGDYAGIAGGWISYWFRPPPSILGELPDSGPILTALDCSASPEGCIGAKMLDIRDAWEQWYSESYDGPALRAELEDFWGSGDPADWGSREATQNLPFLAQKGVVYVRAQSSDDHAQPGKVEGWNAAKALEAACAGGGLLVYQADGGYWAALQLELDLDHCAAEPPRSTSVDSTDSSTWPTWAHVTLRSDTEPSNGTLAWVAAVDLVRWAMNRTF